MEEIQLIERGIKKFLDKKFFLLNPFIEIFRLKPAIGLRIRDTPATEPAFNVLPSIIAASNSIFPVQGHISKRI